MVDRREYDRAYYQRNKGRIRQRDRAYRAREGARLIELKEAKPCTDCGVSYPHYVMQWDHVRGEKVGNVADLARQGMYAAALAEIEKCELVCANCHSARTHRRRVADWEPIIQPAPPSEDCKVCGEESRTPRRKVCRGCYNARQREVMRRRRATSRSHTA